MRSELQFAIEQHPWIADELKRVGLDDQHLYLEGWTFGEQHVHPGVLVGVGAEVPLHFHKHPHTMVVYPGDAVERSLYELYAERSDGEWIQRPMHPMGFGYIDKGIRHKLRLVAGRFGLYACFFPTHDTDGTPRLEPKQWDGPEERAPRPFEAAGV